MPKRFVSAIGSDNLSADFLTQPVPEETFLYPRNNFENTNTIDKEFIFYLNQFSDEIKHICGLVQNGGLYPNQGFLEISELWEELKAMRDSFYPKKKHKQDNLINQTDKGGFKNSKKGKRSHAELVSSVDSNLAKLLAIFSINVHIQCSLISGGKLVPLKGYKRIKNYVKELRQLLEAA